MLAKEFAFHAPEDVETALGLLGGGGIVKVLAGGMSLVPAMNLGLMRPDAIVSLNHVQGLDYVEDDGDAVSARRDGLPRTARRRPPDPGSVPAARDSCVADRRRPDQAPRDARRQPVRTPTRRPTTCRS